MQDLIQSLRKENLNELDLSSFNKHIDGVRNSEYFTDAAGREHYRLLAYLSQNTQNNTLYDIGSYLGYSALALSSNPNNLVLSFDLQYQIEVKDLPDNIVLIIGKIELLIKKFLDNSIILLDTAHDGIFEQDLYNFLIETQYKGTLIIDDINLNDQMRAFWNNISLPKDDITHLAHYTGTGIVYF